jgi:hypothetical protein
VGILIDLKDMPPVHMPTFKNFNYLKEYGIGLTKVNEKTLISTARLLRPDVHMSLLHNQPMGE